MLTKEQIEFRRSAIGGSDIPVILGVNRAFGGTQKNLYDLWLEKTGRVEDEDMSKNKAVEAGNYIEQGALAFAEDHLGKVTRRNLLRRADGLPIRSNIDGILVDTIEPIECKAEGIMWQTRDGWGEEGSGDVPFDVIGQAHGHMIALDSDVCHIIACLQGRGFCIFRVLRDNDIANEIIDRSVEFWKYVTSDTPPDNVIATEPFVKRRIREKGKVIMIDNGPALIDVWQTMKALTAEAKAKEDAAKVALQHAMGDAEITESEDGVVTYFSQDKKNFDKKQLLIDNPKLAEKYISVSSHRVMRFKKAKVK